MTGVSSRLLDDLILEMRASLGTTFVIVSHELASIYAIADSLIFLDAQTRQVAACGNPHQLLQDPGTASSAMLFLTRGERSHAEKVQTEKNAPGATSKETILWTRKNTEPQSVPWYWHASRSEAAFQLPG